MIHTPNLPCSSTVPSMPFPSVKNEEAPDIVPRVCQRKTKRPHILFHVCALRATEDEEAPDIFPRVCVCIGTIAAI